MSNKRPAATFNDFFEDSGISEIAINATAVVYTPYLPVLALSSHCFEYKFSGSGVDCLVELEQSNEIPTDVAGAGSADGNWVVPEDAATFDTNATGITLKLKAYAPAATKFMRLKITGNGGNGADTILTRARAGRIEG